MKKITALILIMIVLTGTALADEHIGYVICNPNSRVNVRESPSKHADVIGYKELGSEITLDGKTNGRWLHIVNANLENSDGWIYEGNVVYSVPREINTEHKATVNNLRARSSADGKIIKTLKKGTKVIVLVKSDKWCVTNTGYIQTRYLEETEYGKD